MTPNTPPPAGSTLRQSARGSIGAGSRQVPLTTNPNKPKLPEEKDISWRDQQRAYKSKMMRYVAEGRFR